MILITVHANNGELAIRNLKKKMQRELVYRELKMGRFYEKASEKKARKSQEAERRKRKVARKFLMENQ